MSGCRFRGGRDNVRIGRVISYEPEIRTLREEGILSEEEAARLIALERREIFSLYGELRTVLYAAVALIVTGVGLLLRENLERIGHGTIITIIALVALACYLFAFTRRGKREGAQDYVLLLGALLLSSDVAYAEVQYRFFGDAWTRHLLILAIVHGVTAYLSGSRLVLSLAITSLAGWVGVDREGGFLEAGAAEAGARLMAAAALVGGWRMLHAWAARSDGPPEASGEAEGTSEVTLAPRSFLETFDHFLAHLAFIGALIWVFDGELEWPGCAIVFVFATIAIVAGVRTQREPFVLYGVVYAVIALDALVIGDLIRDEALIFLWLLISTPLAIALLFFLHRKWGRSW